MAQFINNWMTFTLAALVIVAASAFLPLGFISSGEWITAVGLAVTCYTGRSIAQKLKRG